MDTVTCPACGSSAETEHAEREGISYSRCQGCGTIYASEDISHAVKTENDNPEGRNSMLQHAVRLERLREARASIWTILDFGCGDREFVYYLWDQGLRAIGYDVGYKALPIGKSDAITMIEVIEHLEDPVSVLTRLREALADDGIIYVESTFADQIEDIATHPYVDPRIGHRTILSKKGLEIVVSKAKLNIDTRINPNVVILVQG